MHQYLVGIVVAFFEPILHAWANILDSHFSNNVFPKLSTLQFFGTLLNLVFLPIVLFLDPPQAVAFGLLPFVFIIALINVAYLFPYYFSLRHTDTSIVASLFALGKVFVPVFAFLFLGEALTPLQYTGFALIVLAATLLSLDIRKLKVNRAFVLMSVVAVILAGQAILYKFVFESGANWGGVVVTTAFFEILISGVIMLTMNSLHQIREDFSKVKKNWKLFAAQQGLEWGGNAGSSYGVSVLQVSVAQAISSTQPFFVLLYAYLFRKMFPDFFKELLSRDQVTKKSILFVLTVIGTILVVANGTVIGV